MLGCSAHKLVQTSGSDANLSDDGRIDLAQGAPIPSTYLSTYEERLAVYRNTSTVHDRFDRFFPVQRGFKVKPITFRCPVTDLLVQHWLDMEDELASTEGEEYRPFECPICTRLHFFSTVTGKLFGEK